MTELVPLDFWPKLSKAGENKDLPGQLRETVLCCAGCQEESNGPFIQMTEERKLPDATEIAMIGAALPATLTFVFQRLERLLSSRGAQPEPGVTAPDALVGTLQLPLEPDENRLQTRQAELEVLHDALEDYARGGTPATTSDQRFMRNLARLRAALEDIYSQHLTFEGENRPASGPFVHQKLSTLTGEATGMDADKIAGHSRVVQDVERVDAGAKLIGMKGRQIGG
ncbi:hypothetical protein ABTZ59_33445 [Streptomyces sp. NPDC094034]|uniref:hypothetical protein n=1 Tax=Streptomyces sp. NPDC094034 TaxID=3155309 RepID=UPI003322F067